MLDLSRRRDFVLAAVGFEGGLAVLACGLGWLLGVNPLQPWVWDVRDVGWGLAATMPMLAFFFLTMRYPLGPLLAIREFLIEHLGPILSRCTWYDLILVATMAGLGEEVLFRGLLQPLVGIAGSNVLFGLVHFITLAYAVIAGVIGTYLGWEREWTGNLLSPVITHALYDYVAFLVVVREWRRRMRAGAWPAEGNGEDSMMGELSQVSGESES